VAEDATAAPCPPHHWLITPSDGDTSVQVWVCYHCATRKEVSTNSTDQQLRQPWYSGRPGRPPANRNDTPTGAS